MKILILTDETYARLAALPGAAELLATKPPPLPSERELRQMGKAGETPEAFARAVAYRDAGRAAAEDTRHDLEDLIRQAHEAGVGPERLARWAQLRPRRIYELLKAAA